MVSKKNRQGVPSAARYTYQINWSPEDKEFVATVDEFPMLSWLDRSPNQALIGATSLVEEVLFDLISNQEPVPKQKINHS